MTSPMRQPTSPRRPISVLLFFFFLVLGLFALGDDDVFFLVAGSSRPFAFSGELRLLDRLFNDDGDGSTAAAARRRRHRRLLGVALVGAALRAERNRLAEVVELRVAAIARVLLSQVRHR